MIDLDGTSLTLDHPTAIADTHDAIARGDAATTSVTAKRADSCDHDSVIVKALTTVGQLHNV
ncbi:MAG TPA: hypothetical protein VGK32_03805 [Vicinamibacterales bacterium]|jgi:hypothetical protein